MALPHAELSRTADMRELDITQRIQIMVQQEIKYSCCNYLENSGIVIDQNSRAQMIQWLFQVVDCFKFSRSNVYVAVSCIDRFLGTRQGKRYVQDKNLFQLVYITCIHVAIKLNETSELGDDILVGLCKGMFRIEEINRTEAEILSALDWHVNPPCPRTYLQHFTALMTDRISPDSKRDLMELACYQTEISLFNYDMSMLSRPSVVALASLMNALSLCPEISKYHCAICLRDLQCCTGEHQPQRVVDHVKRVLIDQLGKVNVPEQPKEIPASAKRPRSSSATLEVITSLPIAILE